MAESGWEMWTEGNGTKCFKVTLTSDGAKRMDRVQLAMLEDAGRLIELAFDEATSAAIVKLRAAFAAANMPRRQVDAAIMDAVRALTTENDRAGPSDMPLTVAEILAASTELPRGGDHDLT